MGGWVEFWAEGAALAKTRKLGRARAFWGLKGKWGWGEGGVTEKDSLRPRKPVPPARREASRRLAPPGLPPQSSHSYCYCRGLSPASAPQTPPAGMAATLPQLPPGVGSVERIMQSSSFKACD